jgi:hypothetical protein
VSDLNRDGRVDIVVGNVEAPSTIYFNDGSGHHYTPIHFGDNKGAVYGGTLRRAECGLFRKQAPVRRESMKGCSRRRIGSFSSIERTSQRSPQAK